MSVSKKDFIAISQIIAQCSAPAPTNTPHGKPTLLSHFTTSTCVLVDSLAAYFNQQNPNFNEQRFLAAVRSRLGMRPKTPPISKS